MITGAPVNVKDYGAVGDGSTNDAAAIQAAITAVATTGQGVYIPAGTYKISSALTTTGHLNMFGDGDKSILDFSAATIATSCITVSGALTQIQNITSASKYGSTVTFASAPTLAVGDIFCIYSTDLWFSARSYYYKGEWCECRSVDTVNARVTNPLYDSYTPATTTVYKMSSKDVLFQNLRIVGGANTFGLVKVQFCDNPKFLNVSCYNENYQCIEFDRCYRAEATNCGMYNKGTGTLDDYGILFSNCQKFKVIGGNYYARRHGVTIGGGDYICAVTNREMRVIGATISNDITSGVYSADMHGNMQDCYYQDCTIYNGAGWAGIDNGYDNCAITEQLNGSVIYAGEIKGGMLYVRNSKLLTSGDPSANLRGIIDVGGNSSPINASTNETLNLIVENCYLQAPAATSATSFMIVVNNSSTVFINIKINGIACNAPAMGSVLRMKLESGTAYSQAIIVDNVTNFPAGTILFTDVSGSYASKPLRMMRQSGNIALSAVSGTTSTIASPITLRYVYPKVPVVTTSVGDATNGFTTSSGQNVAATIFSVNQTTIRPALVATSNSNWASTQTFTANWSVAIEEV